MNFERKKSLQGLADLRTETVPLFESEEESVLDKELNSHKYILFKNPSGIIQIKKLCFNFFI